MTDSCLTKLHKIVLEYSWKFAFILYSSMMSPYWSLLEAENKAAQLHHQHAWLDFILDNMHTWACLLCMRCMLVYAFVGVSNIYLALCTCLYSWLCAWCECVLYRIISLISTSTNSAEMIVFCIRKYIFSLLMFNFCWLWCPNHEFGFLLLQVRYEEIMSDSAYLDRLLAEGATKAADIADATLNNVYQAMGFLRRWAELMLQ